MDMPFWLVSLALTIGLGPETIEAVDLYGLRSVSPSAVRAAIQLVPGDSVPDSIEPIRQRLLRIPGIRKVEISAVCCGEKGGSILYVGIAEMDAPSMSYRAAPTGNVELPTEIVALGDSTEEALEAAVRRGASGEDASRGYSLSVDSSARRYQERFVAIAASRFDLLAAVLRNSSNASHRARAAQIIAYGADKKAVVRELLPAVLDPSDVVRNNATRALALLARWSNDHSQEGLQIPGGVFIDFLNSVTWTDRNKGIFVLVPLTQGRDAALLADLRARAFDSVVEMARWSSPGHATGAFLLVARLAGVDDGEAFQAFQAGDREKIIARAQVKR
jgi:hypothetical protein